MLDNNNSDNHWLLMVGRGKLFNFFTDGISAFIYTLSLVSGKTYHLLK